LAREGPNAERQSSGMEPLSASGCRLRSNLGLMPLPTLQISSVSDSLHSAIGATTAPSRENLGHNNNLSFVITAAGVVVINGGDNARLAAALHEAIRERTQQPVRYVINENGQGHAFLGNAYWADLGVPIIAHRDAISEIREHGEAVLMRMQERMGDLAAGTRVVLPTIAVDEYHELLLGETRIEIRSFGAAHSPGDISVWLPQERLLVAGDIAFHERLLGIFPDSDVDGWIEAFERMTALDPRTVVPGHGSPTDIATLRFYTQGYLRYLRDEIASILEDYGDLSDAYGIDQSVYEHLDTFEDLALKNVGRLFRQMEAEQF
jgi:glyoxylase-like metal-dependent hydrolase (beta-lactamase superfamily II)